MGQFRRRGAARRAACPRKEGGEDVENPHFKAISAHQIEKKAFFQAFFEVLPLRS
jgi:hypothetical protein